MSNSTKKQIAINALKDCAAGFAHYDRKDDEELSADDVRDLCASGELTQADILAAFVGDLRDNGIEVKEVTPEPEHPAVTLLREIEWSQRNNGCPVCANEKIDGHAPGCRLAAILAGSASDAFTAYVARHEPGDIVLIDGRVQCRCCPDSFALTDLCVRGNASPDDRPLRERILDALEAVLPPGSQVTMTVVLPAKADTFPITIAIGADKDRAR